MIHLQFPSTLGMDFSGVIKQVGEGVPSDFKQGDEVYGQAGVTSGGSGAFAELALANAESIAHKPKRLSHVEAAALPLVGVSAWHALVENIGLSSGQKILIHGGAGGIGSIAIQLAKNLGYDGANIAASLLLLSPEVISSAILFRAMVPFMPEQVLDLTTKNIFMGAGEYDPIVTREQTEMLFRLFKDAGANVILHWQKNSGHELGYDEISAAKDWLSNLPKKLL